MKIGIAVVQFGDESQFMCKKQLDELKPPFFVAVQDNNKENIGFSRGNNKLIRNFLWNGSDCEWEAQEADWIWLLNNDTTVPKETFDAILEILPTLDEKVGVVGFKILSMNNPDLIHHGGTVSCFPGGIHKSGSVKLHQLTKRTREKWVTFASVLIRKEVFTEIGLLDEGMFNYFSDSDFCYRARYAGFDVIYEPRFVIYHKIGSSQNPNKTQQQMLYNDSLVFQNKHMNGKAFFDLDNELL